MNIFLALFLCLICFGAGWVSGVNQGKDLEKMVDGVEKGVEFLEGLDLELIKVETISKDIDLLLHLDSREEQDAREYLIASLKQEYKDMQEGVELEMISDEMKNQMDRMKELSQKYEAFKLIVSE